MIVSFRSAFGAVAQTLFEQTFENIPTTLSVTGASYHFTFEDDTHVCDVRSWVSDAIGCGLITMGAVQVN